MEELTEEENNVNVVIAVEKNRERTGEVTVNLCLNFNEDVHEATKIFFSHICYMTV
jgi:hypothetical protein